MTGGEPRAGADRRGAGGAPERPVKQTKGPAMQDPKDPRTSGKVAMYALVVIAALTGLMIWVAA